MNTPLTRKQFNEMARRIKAFKVEPTTFINEFYSFTCHPVKDDSGLFSIGRAGKTSKGVITYTFGYPVIYNFETNCRLLAQLIYYDNEHTDYGVLREVESSKIDAYSKKINNELNLFIASLIADYGLYSVELYWFNEYTDYDFYITYGFEAEKHELNQRIEEAKKLLKENKYKVTGPNDKS